MSDAVPTAVHGRIQVRLWAVIGPPKTGKSTTIGHLAYSVALTKRVHLSAEMRVVPLRGGGLLRVLAVPQAFQEWNPRLPVKAGEWVEGEADKEQRRQDTGPDICASYFNVLAAFRLSSVTSKGQVYPDAHEYLSHFVQRGWSLESIFLLGSTTNDRDFFLRFGAPVSCYKTSTSEYDEINVMVGAARNHFGWA